jgi:methylmalonyl-CoA/ethylmalonyl-CoA epimerase
MVNKIEHIGIAVENIEQSLKIYEEILGLKCYKTEIVESEAVKTAFIAVGESKIELLEATSETSPIAKFLNKKGRGIHHIAFDVDNLESELERLLLLDYELIHKTPKHGADNKLIAFLHPKSTDGVLIELCQDKVSV